MNAILDYVLRPDFIIFIVSVLILILFFAYRLYVRRREKRFIGTAFSQYISPEVILEMLKNKRIEELKDKISKKEIEREKTPSPESTKTKAGDIKTDEATLLDEILKSMPRIKQHRGTEAIWNKQEKSFNWYLLIRTCISLAVLGVALYIIIEGRSSDKSSEWAYGAVGTVIGYWLK